MPSSLRLAIVPAVVLAIGACRTAAPIESHTVTPASADFRMTDALRIADSYRVAAITNRRLPHAEY
ncbi:MAG TPA: hypothetical protein VIP11_04450, partial [Gemmatimonadaceae bacterium]